MQTNDLKKGVRVQLRNGWQATMQDNKKGNSRLATVYGFVTEMGSVYAHDIVSFQDVNGEWLPVEHTDKQKQVKKFNDAFWG
jgi:hypothetical protein